MCEGWPATFVEQRGVSSFTSHKNQITVSAVRRDLRFFVLIREDLFADAMHFLLSYLKTLSVILVRVRARDLPLSRPAVSKLS